MKNAIILLAFFFALTLSFAQNKNTTWGLRVTPEMNLMHVSGAPNMGTANVNQTLGFSLGLVSRYHVSDWFQIESGVQLRHRSYSYALRQILMPAGLDPNGGMTFTSISESTQLGFISIPGKARISLGGGFAIDAGISLDLPILNRRNRDIVNGFDDPALSRGGEFNVANVSYTVGFHQEIKLNGAKLEIGPRLNLSQHQYDTSFGLSSEYQFAAGFQLTLMRE
jgi:hypothetical protein